MSPALLQALQRLVVIAVVGGLSAVAANLTVLDGALGTNALVLIPVLTAVIDAVLKYLGGPTVQAPSASTPMLSAAPLADRPPFWAA